MLKDKCSGFTLTELLVGIAIASILMMLALPKLSSFTVRLRVDNEISALHRLILITRNSAINSGKSAIICPLSSTLPIICTTKWHQAISVFIDNNNDGNYDDNDTIVSIKAAIPSIDKLHYAQTSLIYTALGNLSASPVTSVFSYCPSEDTDKSRAIIVSASGRSYITSDTDNDGKDEDRNKNPITCS
ncbi:GspH/FimT family pseudopilin [Cognaticolwellia mytili]|uniref:GspH/FimT family pseudopilin n=1 Tax=Cognaticolwellia mytili TaxID=1888913 RepID=UPI000A175428|nr:GspH/FimT family pseudopilin [Cognaticolwellia mytili]